MWTAAVLVVDSIMIPLVIYAAYLVHWYKSSLGQRWRIQILGAQFSSEIEGLPDLENNLLSFLAYPPLVSSCKRARYKAGYSRCC